MISAGTMKKRESEVELDAILISEPHGIELRMRIYVFVGRCLRCYVIKI